MSGLPPRVGALLRMELRLISRDPSALMSMLLLPLVVVGFGVALTLGAEGGQARRAAEEVATVAGPPELWAVVTDEDHLQQVKLDEDPAVVVEVSATDAEGRAQALTLRFEGTDRRTLQAVDRVEVALDRWRAADLAARWAEAGAPIAPDEVLQVEVRDLATAAQRAGDALARLLPPLLVAVLLSGALPVGIAVLPTERQNGNLETLMVSSLDRRSLLLGKAGIIFGAAALVAMMGFLAVALLIGLSPLSVGPLALGPLPIPMGRLAAVALLAIPLILQVTGGITAIAAHARDPRQARVLSGPLLVLAGGLASVPALNGAVELPLLALLPVAGPAIAMSATLSDQSDLRLTVLAMLSGVGWSAASLWLAARSLRGAAVLAGPAEDRSAGRTTREAVAVTLAAFTSFWFISQLAQARALIPGLILSQLVCIALPGVLGVLASGQPLRDRLSLRLPSGGDLALGVVAGLLCPLVGQLVAGLQAPFVPTPASAIEAFAAALNIGEIPLPVVILVFAALPAVCEELLFRGALLGLLRASLPRPAQVMVVAALFGLLHMTAFRILPTGALGLLFGVAALRSRSLLVPVLMHFLNNGLLVGLVGLGVLTEDALSPPLWAGALALLVVMACLRAMGRGGPPPSAAD